MRLQKGHIDTFIAQVAAPGLFVGFSFRGFEKTEGGGFMNHSKQPEERTQ